MLAPLLPDLRPPLTFSHSAAVLSPPQLFPSAADSLQGSPSLPLPLLLTPQPARFATRCSSSRDRYVAGEENPEVFKHERLLQYPFMNESTGQVPRLTLLYALRGSSEKCSSPSCWCTKGTGRCIVDYTVKSARGPGLPV